MLNANGFTEEAKRVVAAKRVVNNELKNTVLVSGKNNYGAWSATVVLGDDNAIK